MKQPSETGKKMTNSIQTIDQAIAAIEAAGHKAFGSGVDTKFYDPRKRGAFIQLDPGYRNAEFAEYCETKQASQKRGGPSGEFCAEIRKILADNRKAILAR